MTDFAKSTPSTIEIVQRDNAYEGFYKLDRVQLRHEKFDGGMSRVINREVFVRHDAVCVLPYDPQRDEVVLIEQFRVGALGRTDNPWLIEMVAGLIDKDEEPEEVAHREAEEEAGLAFSALWPITKYFPSPGGSTEFVHLYLGRCDSSGAGGVHGLEEEAEDIRVTVWARRIGVTHGDQMLGVLALEVIVNCPYTTTLRVCQEHSLPWLPVPQLEVQVYHDARMAEVISAEHARRFRSIYPYPNVFMHQPDEKAQLNVFLGEWLSHCLALGHEFEAVR
jgi:ADP-ribose pyrophosphatase